MEELIRHIPKCELHVHIEGTLEPELLLEMAQRNKVSLPYRSIKEIHAAYHFTDLQSFLNLYYQGMEVLKNERDFYDLTFSYLQKVSKQNVKHVEIFFDPQAHLRRGILIEPVVRGIHAALLEGKKLLGISFHIIPCLLRDLSEESAFRTLEELLPYHDMFAAFGLDSTEAGNPPKKFQAVFDKVRSYGFKTVAHAGEEGPADYIWQAIQLLHVSRIDHGEQCLNDPELVHYLVNKQLPLTSCPISKLKLKGIKQLADHPLKRMLDLGICTTINSDDPAYFGAYIQENYLRCANDLHLTHADIFKLACNAFRASFLAQPQKDFLIAETTKIYNQYKDFELHA